MWEHDAIHIRYTDRQRQGEWKEAPKMEKHARQQAGAITERLAEQAAGINYEQAQPRAKGKVGVSAAGR